MRSRPIRIEAGLVRQARDFFEHHLYGVMSLADAVIRKPELAPKIKGKRQMPLEELIVDFGGYTLLIESPEQEPPLGRVQLLNIARGLQEEGPLDVLTWERLGQIVKASPPDPALTPPRPNLEKDEKDGIHRQRSR